MGAEAPSRRRFLSTNAWYAFVNDLQKAPETGVDLYALRTGVYHDIEALRQRPLLVYAVKFITAGNPGAPISIDLGDVDGFTDLISAVAAESNAVDVLIHSPGGSPEATERIVSMLRERFDDVHFLVPHSAYSAATMLALSGNTVILHPSATLGPIDPQINGTPARLIRRGFDRVRELLKEEGPEALPAYLPLLEKHSLEILEICDDSLTLSKELVTEWLGKYMFAKDADAAQTTISKAVEFFSDYDKHKTHSRPLTYTKLKELGLSITVAESPLRELMREAYIVLNGFFTLTPFVKLFENAHGLSWGRQFQLLSAQQPVTEQIEALYR
jgi:hypothetical protein